MRESAKRLFGDPSEPLSRPNVFGELFKAFISPMPVIEEAVNWVLQGQPDPDISVHMRMLNSKSFSAPHAAYNCIQKVIKNSPKSKSLARVVLVSDTPYTVALLKEQLEGVAQVIHFDYELFIRSQHNLSEVLSKNYFKPPEKRVRDWGSMPRWVAIVDMFLAARAKTAVISGANRRVGTTYVQLLAALAAARRLGINGDNHPLKFYSSFQAPLIAEGLAGQRGWGHTWRRFGGRLSCTNQTRQCAETPILPYAWWDGPWQSPLPRDNKKMLVYGVKVLESGQVEEDSLPRMCRLRKATLETLQLVLPSCKQLKTCHHT
ncbi:hypothetical protein KP509_15G042000 [Ceratopteris richardii]|nr:hypothetical protein KP509_15G042000 [Ceratopteris richardii]